MASSPATKMKRARLIRGRTFRGWLNAAMYIYLVCGLSWVVYNCPAMYISEKNAELEMLSYKCKNRAAVLQTEVLANRNSAQVKSMALFFWLKWTLY